MSKRKHPLIKYLEKTGRTMTEVAEKAGCSRMTLYRLIKGEQNATIDLLSKVSTATNGEVPVSAFMNRESAA
jgi:DNA-binding phage protein